MSSNDIIAFLGEPMVEFAQRDRALPNDFVMGFGGDTSNAAIAAARQGARTRFLGQLGADQFGEAIRRLWRAEQVDETFVIADDDAPTGHYFVTQGPQGHAFSYTRKGSASSRLRPEQVTEDMFGGVGILHVSGISQAIGETACDSVYRAMEIARNRGVLISYDPNVRLKLWGLARARAIISSTIAMTDVLLPSTEDLALLLDEPRPDAQLDWCLDQGAQVVVLKMGGEGCVVATRSLREKVAPAQANFVDGTGAGDCFDGAFLSQLASGASITDAAQYACAAASIAVEGIGAVAPIPYRGQVLLRLESRHRHLSE